MTRPSPALEDLSRRHTELEILYQTIQDFTSTLAVHEVFQRLLERLLLHLHSEIASILLQGTDGLMRIVASHGLPQDVVARTRVGVGDGISGHVLETGLPLLVPNVEVDDRFRRRNRERYYTCSLISAPLVFDGQTRGVINVNNKRDRQPHQPQDLRLLEAIAGQAAIALSNARRYEEVLERARHDPLTGLANHGHFWSMLEIELSRSRRHDRRVGLVLIDIDHFKSYNDAHGHLEGDQALIAVGNVLRRSSRTHDVVARYGGEEFAVILPETPPEGARVFAEKVRSFVADSDLGRPHGAALTLSAGVADFPSDASTPGDLVRIADERLYRAKAEGRNRVCG